MSSGKSKFLYKSQNKLEKILRQYGWELEDFAEFAKQMGLNLLQVEEYGESEFICITNTGKVFVQLQTHAYLEARVDNCNDIKYYILNSNASKNEKPIAILREKFIINENEELTVVYSENCAERFLFFEDGYELDVCIEYLNVECISHVQDSEDIDIYLLNLGEEFEVEQVEKDIFEILKSKTSEENAELFSISINFFKNNE